MKAEHLIHKIEILLRAMPTEENIDNGSDESLEWLGRASAIIGNWSVAHTLEWNQKKGFLVHSTGGIRTRGMKGLKELLYQAKYTYMLDVPTSGNVAIDAGMVYQYFDEIRKKIETAKSDIFFVDPYLDATFVSNYLPFVGQGVSVRLLTSKKSISTLMPAVGKFAIQNKLNVAVRSTQNIHDRHVLIDNLACYQSGASIKDGGRNKPTTLVEICDTFEAVRDTYEKIWNGANIEK